MGEANRFHHKPASSSSKPLVLENMLVLSSQQQSAYPPNFLCYDAPVMQMPQARVHTEPRICQYWAKDGRCPCRSCPYASSHTAENSPRYSKFIPQEEAVHSRRANAFVIEEPMKAKHTVVEGARRPNALTIEEPKKRPHALPIEEPTARPNALVIKQPVKVRSAALEIKDALEINSTSRDRTPSPPGSRLGRWMGK